MNSSKVKNFFFAIIPALILCVVLEGASYAILKWKGKLDDSMAFHPLFRTQHYKSTTFTGNRFMYDPYLGYRYAPNTTYANLKINERGFIGNGNAFPVLESKPAGTKRIFILGGSTVAGPGSSSNATTIAASLEKQLNEQKNGVHYEVINAGVDGYMSFEEFVFFLTNIYRYQPDTVIFFDGWNDFVYPTAVGGYADAYQKDCCWPNAHEYGLYLITLQNKLLNEGVPLINTSSLIDKTYTTYLLKKVLLKNWEGGTEIDVRKKSGKVLLSPEESAQRYSDNVANAVYSFVGRNVHLVYAYQPVIMDKPNLAPKEKDILNSPRADVLKGYKEYQAIVRKRLLSLQQETSKSKNIKIVDLSQSMWGNTGDEAYLDECHTNDFGNALIAKNLSKLVD